MGNIRELNLESCVAVDSSEYIFSEDIANKVEDTMRELSTQEYFSPKNNAWWIFRQMYLVSIPGLELGHELYNAFTENDFGFDLRGNPLSELWTEFDNYRKSSQGLYFKGVAYSQIERMSLICSHYHKNIKFVKAKGDDPQFRFEVLKAFLDTPSDTALMCAVYAWFHTSYRNKLLDEHYHNVLCDRLADWIDRYKKEFLEARELIRSRESYYRMFDEVGQGICFSMWDTTLEHLRANNPDLLARPYLGLIEGLPTYLREMFQTYTNIQPQNVIKYYTYEMLWNLMWELFCLDDSEQQLIYTMHIMFVSVGRWESFRRMCADFIFERPQFTKGLAVRYYNMISDKYDRDTVRDMCSEYQYSLLSNGYPAQWAEDI